MSCMTVLFLYFQIIRYQRNVKRSVVEEVCASKRYSTYLWVCASKRYSTYLFALGHVTLF